MMNAFPERQAVPELEDTAVLLHRRNYGDTKASMLTTSQLSKQGHKLGAALRGRRNLPVILPRSTHTSTAAVGAGLQQRDPRFAAEV